MGLADLNQIESHRREALKGDQVISADVTLELNMIVADNQPSV